MFDSRRLIMGIVNVTPDSFSDGGRFLRTDAAIAHARQLIADGADIIDIGGESTRPGAEPVTVDDELARVIPVIEAVCNEATVSVDTMKAEVARAAVAAGARIINDVSASLYEVAADTGSGWIAMHMQGEPRTMQEAPHYDDVVGEVREFLAERAGRASSVGLDDVWLDPGIGFGKTTDHNLTLLKHLGVLAELPFPLAVGTSRKRFLGAITDTAEAADRVEASMASAMWSWMNGAQMVRVHDVKQTVRVRAILAAIEAAGG